MREMVDQHMRIADENIRLVLPNCIQHTLVGKTQDFIKEDLFGKILKIADTQEARAKLLQVSSSHKKNIDELLKLKLATKQALDVLVGERDKVK